MKELETYYCPECHNQLERISGCGSVAYMCNTCKKLISRKRMLKYDEATNTFSTNTTENEDSDI